MRGKHVRANRKIRRAVRFEVDRVGLSKSNVDSNLRNLVYHPGLTDSGPEPCLNSKSSGNFEENVCYYTEEDLEEMSLKHLELLYNKAISKLVELGYEEGVALRAILSGEQYYGESDVLTNIVNTSLAYLNSSSDSNGKIEDESEISFRDLRDLEEYTLADMIYSLQQVKPNLSKGDAMLCLLISEFHVGRASTLNIPNSGNRACCTKEDGSTLDLAGFTAPTLCRFHGGWDFGSGGGPEFSGNGFSMNNTEYKLEREIECPRRFNLSPSMKSLLKRNVAVFAAGFRANMKQKEIQSETSYTDPAHVEQPRNSASEDSFCSVLEKFRDLNLDDNLESVGEDDKDGVIVNLLQVIKDLEKKLKERKDWAHKKAMQVAQKVSDEQAELKSLSSEREGIKLLKKGNLAIEESTAKRLSDMENALKKASTQIDRAKAIIRKLENQNAEIRAEREGYKLSASESLRVVTEASKKEKKWMKKLVTWEKQKLKLQDEITAEKEKIKALNMALDQITQDENEIEVCWFMYYFYKYHEGSLDPYGF